MSVKQLSREEFRKQYLASLELENRNAAKNLEANKLFIQTGQPTPVTDTRTITEKLADIEGLKTLLLTELRKITDSTSASDIIGKLSGDPETLKFLYQNFGAIERDIKPRFRSGVPSDIFIPYLRKYMERFEQTQGVDVPVTAETIAEAIETEKETSLAIKEAVKGIQSIESLDIKRDPNQYDSKTKSEMLRHFKVIIALAKVAYTKETDEAVKAEIQRLLKKHPTSKLNSGVRVLEAFRKDPSDWTDIWDIANAYESSSASPKASTIVSAVTGTSTPCVCSKRSIYFLK